jgi:hypothetical protein
MMVMWFWREKRGGFSGEKLHELRKQAGRPFAETGGTHCPPFRELDDAQDGFRIPLGFNLESAVEEADQRLF